MALIGQLSLILPIRNFALVNLKQDFISDRQKGLLPALRNVLPYCHHAYCVWHLAENATGKGYKHAKPFIYQHARSTTIEEYNCLFEELNQLSPSAADYISRIEPEFWVECMFSGNRHGMITSNLVESMNACIAEARELPVTHMLEVIREKIAKWFLARREEEKKAENGVTVAVEKKLVSRMNVVIEEELYATKVDEGLYEVRYKGKMIRVNIGENYCDSDCQCGRWKKEGIPCVHALTVLRNFGSRGQNYCSQENSTETFLKVYQGKVFGVDDVRKNDSVRHIEPPVNKPPPGCPGKVRGRKGAKPTVAFKRSTNQSANEEFSEEKEQRRCSLCRQGGHNKATCPQRRR
ncbi:hypothetical protein GEMRC1_013592 [Eukaryota sp. GEM-RC1]